MRKCLYAPRGHTPWLRFLKPRQFWWSACLSTRARESAERTRCSLDTRSQARYTMGLSNGFHELTSLNPACLTSTRKMGCPADCCTPGLGCSANSQRQSVCGLNADPYSRPSEHRFWDARQCHHCCAILSFGCRAHTLSQAKSFRTVTRLLH